MQQVDEEKFTSIKALCGEDSYPECFKEATAYSLTDDAINLKIDAVFAVLKNVESIRSLVIICFSNNARRFLCHDVDHHV